MDSMKKHSDSIVEKDIIGIPSATLKSLYLTMLRIRRFEERVAELLPQNEIKCPVHLCIGQEAVAAGVCANLQRDDYVFSTHRSHGHYIAKGGDLKLLMAELYGRRTGCSKGKGGSMHLVASEVGFPGSSSIVGGNIPLAVGAALASVIQGDGRVAIPFFGDGAVDEGIFYECLNFASLKKLPVVFICENNFYATHLHILERQPADNIFRRAESYIMPGVQIDGNDVASIFQASREAIEDARSGKGPTLIECRTYRWRGHVGPNFDFEYRSKAEFDGWLKRCPVKTFEKYLLSRGILSELEKKRISEKIEEEVEVALIFARESPFPNEGELTEDVIKT